jgi:hypothetical protein
VCRNGYGGQQWSLFNEDGKTADWESDWNGTERFGEASGRSNERLKEKDQKAVLSKTISAV